MRLSCLVFLSGGFAVAAAMEPAEYQARLLSPLASHSAEGTQFQARIVGALARTGTGTLPAGSVVSGRVVEAHPIKLGLRRERAVLRLQFDSCQLPSGEHLPAQRPWPQSPTRGSRCSRMGGSRAFSPPATRIAGSEGFGSNRMRLSPAVPLRV